MAQLVSDKEYLQRPLLNVSYVITPEKIDIQTDSTSFAYIYRYKRFTKTELLKRYSRILKKARAKGITIKYSRHIKRNLEEVWEAYAKECAVVDELYKTLLKKYTVLKERGIHVGCMDDQYLQQCHELRWEYERHFHRTTPIGKVNSLAIAIAEMDQFVTQVDSMQETKIYL